MKAILLYIMFLGYLSTSFAQAKTPRPWDRPDNANKPFEISLSAGPQFNFLKDGVLSDKFIAGLNTDMSISKGIGKNLMLRLGLGYSKFNLNSHLQGYKDQLLSIDSNASFFMGDHNQYRGILGLDYIIKIGKGELRLGLGGGLQLLDHQRNKLSFIDPLQGGTENVILDNPSGKTISPTIENNISYQYKFSKNLGVSANVKTNFIPHNNIPSTYKQVYQDDVMDYQAICNTPTIQGYQHIPITISPSLGLTYSFDKPRTSKPTKPNPGNNESAEKTIQNVRIDSVSDCFMNISGLNQQFSIYYFNPHNSTAGDRGTNNLSITLECLGGLIEMNPTTFAVNRGSNTLTINDIISPNNCTSNIYIVRVSWITNVGTAGGYVDTIQFCNEQSCKMEMNLVGQNLIDNPYSNSPKDCSNSVPSGFTIHNLSTSNQILSYNYEVRRMDGLNPIVSSNSGSIIINPSTISTIIPLNFGSPIQNNVYYLVRVSCINQFGDTCMASERFIFCLEPPSDSCLINISHRFLDRDTCITKVNTQFQISGFYPPSSVIRWTLLDVNNNSIVSTGTNLTTNQSLNRNLSNRYCFIATVEFQGQIICRDTHCVFLCDTTQRNCIVNLHVGLQNIMPFDSCKKRVNLSATPFISADLFVFEIYNSATGTRVFNTFPMSFNFSMTTLNTGSYYAVVTRTQIDSTICRDTVRFSICAPPPCAAPCNFNVNKYWVSNGGQRVSINVGDTITKYCNGENFKVWARITSLNSGMRASFRNDFASATIIATSGTTEIAGEVREPASNGSVHRIIDTIYIFDSCGRLCNKHLYHFYVRCECCDKFTVRNSNATGGFNIGNILLSSNTQFTNPENIPFTQYETELVSISIDGDIVHHAPFSFIFSTGITNLINTSYQNGNWISPILTPNLNQLMTSTMSGINYCTNNSFGILTGILSKSFGNRNYTITYCIRYRFYVSQKEVCEKTICHQKKFLATTPSTNIDFLKKDLIEIGLEDKQMEDFIKKANTIQLK